MLASPFPSLPFPLVLDRILSRRKGFHDGASGHVPVKRQVGGCIGRSVASVSRQRKECQAKNFWSMKAADISGITMEERGQPTPGHDVVPTYNCSIERQ